MLVYLICVNKKFENFEKVSDASHLTPTKIVETVQSLCKLKIKINCIVHGQLQEVRSEGSKYDLFYSNH